MPLPSQTTFPTLAANELNDVNEANNPLAETQDAESVPFTIASPSGDTPLQETETPPVITLVQPTNAQVTAFPTLVAATSTPRFITPGSPLGPVTPDTATPTSDAPPTSTPSGLITPTSLPGTEDDDCSYIVQPGDNLYSIATNRGYTVEDMRAANPDLVGDPPILQVGQILQLPECETDGETTTSGNTTPAAARTTAPATPAPSLPAGGQTYTVRAGDTLYTIAMAHGLTVQEIIDANNLPNPDRLDIGQIIILPSPS